MLLLVLLLMVALSTELSMRGVDEPAARPTGSAALSADASLCGHVPDRPPRLLTAKERMTLPQFAGVVPLTFRICESRSVHCSTVLNLTTPFTAGRPAPPAQGLTSSDSERLRRQFWWQTRPELAPRPFGWVLPQDGGAGVDGGTSDPGELARLRSLAGLFHSYGVGVGRIVGAGGGFVELCKRCPHEGALLRLPDDGTGAEAGAARTPGVNALVQWAARVIKEPPKRAARRADIGYYARAAARPVESHARLLVLVQRFSADYGHFLTELLPRAVAAAPLVRADASLRLLVDCSAGFVAPWLGFLLGVDAGRLVCSESGVDRLVHADCLAFSRFDAPFPSGWRLGLDLLRAAAHAQLHKAAAHTAGGPRPLVVWAGRDPGRFTAHAVRSVHGVERLFEELRSAMPAARLTVFRASQHTPRSTVRLFARAAAVLGPSGSALHNVVFSRPGTLVVEVLPEDLTYANIWIDSSLLGLRYRAVHVPGFRCSNNVTLGQAEARRIAHALAPLLVSPGGP